jgi:hypothetical protein
VLWRGAWIVGAFAGLLVLATGMIAAGGALGSQSLVGLGVLAFIVAGALAPVCVVLSGAADRGSSLPLSGAVKLEALLNEIHAHTMLSDNAKRVLFRERELELLRHAIEADIHAGKYNAAITLCDEMGDLFGYREDAEAFRERIIQARQDHYDTEVRAAVTHFEDLLQRRAWAEVHHEAARIRRLYGDSLVAQDLDARILAAREEHKRALEGEFLRSAERDDVEGAMALLKELDRYLDHEEGERLSQVAHGVVTRHRENLGTQFKLAVNDHRWAEAVAIGETIIAEVPNTKMAGEVRSMLELLRSRAEHSTLTTGPRP